jgi:hypothetical protein
MRSPANQGSTSWEYREVADQRTIEDLLDVFHHLVYPMQVSSAHTSHSRADDFYRIVYFHWPSFLADVLAQRHITDQAFYASVMGVCAIASGRLQEGLQLPLSFSQPDRNSLPASAIFYQACVDAIPTGLESRTDFNFLRAKALLCMACTQYNDPRTACIHHHDYLNMAALEGIPNESRWPSDLNEIQVQERRRLVSSSPAPCGY